MSQEETIAVETRGVWVSTDKKWILEDINLLIEKGHFEIIIGPNGAGKTTLLKVILGLIEPRRGEVKVFGYHPKELKKRGSLIGYVPQRPLINPNFPVTVFDTVLMGRYGKVGLVRCPSFQDREVALKNLRRVGLEHLKDSIIGQLSGGQQQRAFIARALCNDPQLLILDEPAIALDVTARDQFYQLLLELKQTLDLTILLVTHDLSVVSIHNDNVICLNQKLYTHSKLPLHASSLQSCYGCQVEYLFHGKVPHRVVEGGPSES